MFSPANGAGGAQGAGFGAVRARLVWRGNYRNGDKRSASSVTFDNVQGTASAVPRGRSSEVGTAFRPSGAGRFSDGPYRVVTA
jgi:hypothetical protein